eukprot:6192811-Pleurochrysis_carterae.AAC.3
MLIPHLLLAAQRLTTAGGGLIGGASLYRVAACTSKSAVSFSGGSLYSMRIRHLCGKHVGSPRTRNSKAVAKLGHGEDEIDFDFSGGFTNWCDTSADATSLSRVGLPVIPCQQSDCFHVSCARICCL